MKSKITIHTAPNFKPCIKVVEAKNHYLTTDGSEEDVRDVLVKGFRELLAHKSHTAQVIFEGSEGEYIILPVEDELKYFEGLIYQKYIGDSGSREKLLEIAKMIDTHLNTTVTTS